MKLERDDWAQLLRHLETALDLPEPERAGWLEALALNPPSLKDALRQMLADRARIETDDFLAAGARLDPLPAPSAPAGGQFGPWRLLRELGRGGMATVWLARREDGAHAREVALKLPHPWVGSHVVLERFRRERRILSTLQHPHIAQVLDAGEADGQPWLALEYVAGRPITEHAAAQKLSTPARLRLFLDVLRAVQHAHAQLVIHRDLKPANVLVDTAGEVKLLDFGVAKLLGDDGLGEDTALTREAGHALTPQYASPEQIAGEPLGVASDVYSLGVLLYELLTGQRPYTLARASAAALEEALLSATVRRPSEVANDKALRGDLDTLVMKALQREPGQRYASAEAMAQDIERHLRSEPILARPDRLAYRLRKLWGRRKLPILAGVAVALALTSGGALALWQARAARAEALNAKAVRDFMAELFRSSSTNQRSAEQMQRLSARELLGLGAARIDALKGSAPEAHADLLALFGDLHQELSLYEQAVTLHARAAAAARAVYGPEARQTLLAELEQGWALSVLGRIDEARPLITHARSVFERRAPRSADHAQALHYEALTQLMQDAPQAVRTAREAVAMFDALRDRSYRSAMAQQLLGEALGAAGNPAESVTALDEALRRFDALLGPGSMAAAYAMNSRADSLKGLGRWQEAGAAMTQVVDIFRRHDASGVDMAGSLIGQAQVLFAAGERARGSQALQQALVERARHGDPTTPPTAPEIEGQIALQFFAEGDLPGAARALTEVLAHTPRQQHLPRLAFLTALSQTQLALGQLGPARQNLAEAEAVLAASGATAIRAFDVAKVGAQLAAAQGDAAAARAALVKAEQALGPAAAGHRGLAVLQARVLLRLGDTAQATAATAPFVPRLLADDPQLSLSQRGALALVAAQARQASDPDSARRLAEAALRALTVTQVPGSPDLAAARALLAAR